MKPKSKTMVGHSAFDLLLTTDKFLVILSCRNHTYHLLSIYEMFLLCYPHCEWNRNHFCFCLPVFSCEHTSKYSILFLKAILLLQVLKASLLALCCTWGCDIANTFSYQWLLCIFTTYWYFTRRKPSNDLCSTDTSSSRGVESTIRKIIQHRGRMQFSSSKEKKAMSKHSDAIPAARNFILFMNLKSG